MTEANLDSTSDNTAKRQFLAGGGEMGALIRAHDWQSTPVGPPENWPQSLRTVVRLMLTSHHPMFVFWGPEHFCFYNDAYRTSLGPEKHPRVLGARGRDQWPEIWDLIGPQISLVMSGKGATWHEDQLIPITRHGQTDRAYWTYGFSPIDEDSATNQVGGVLVVCNETTAKVQNDIRNKFRLQLEERLLGLSDPHAVLTIAAEIIGKQIKANWVGYVEIDGTGEYVSTTFTWAAEGFQRISGKYRLDGFGDGIAVALRAGRTVVIDDITTHPLTATSAAQDAFRAIGRRSLISVPLMTSGRLVAVLTVSNADTGTNAIPWEANEVALVEEVAQRTKSAVERARTDAALLESEARFQAITNSIDHMVWSTDANGYTDFYNQRWYDFTGVVEGATDGPAWRYVFHPDDQERAWAAWQHSLTTAETFHIEYRLRHHSGEYRWVLGRAQPVRNHAGQITRWYGTCTDIEEIVEARDVLARSREELERIATARAAELVVASEQLRQSQKMEAIGQLTGGIAHDFNNMLAVVMGSLSLLQRRVGQDLVALRHVGAASDSARRAALLIKRLLAFSRQQPLAPEAIDTNQLVAGMSDLLHHTLGGNIVVETSLAENLWPTHADPNQFENVILNLAVNARDAMPDGGTLTITTQNIDFDANQAAQHLGIAAGQYVMLSVTDTGLGMPAEILAKAFDPFFTTKAIGKGTGLGLSQVYGFLKQSGGHVNISSEVGKGTAVAVYLPRRLRVESDMTGAPSLREILSSDRQKLVLIVDDLASVRRFVADAVIALGYRIIEADGGAMALRLIDAHPEIALLLTDIVMPDMDGRLLAEEARRRRRNLKILFMTGYAPEAGSQSATLSPGIKLITKPFTVEELAEKINEALDAMRADNSTGAFRTIEVAGAGGTTDITGKIDTMGAVGTSATSTTSTTPTASTRAGETR